LNAFLAVAFGAFGAHVLEARVEPARLDTFATGVQYHMYHALGLLIIGLLAERMGASRRMQWAGRLLLIGIILFSGSLYLLVLTGVTVLGAITPLGGVSFLAGWLLVALDAWSRR
jgi:uncharacterized membrane protein YgdD (TMEM256/DUF423 family)